LVGEDGSFVGGRKKKGKGNLRKEEGSSIRAQEIVLDNGSKGTGDHKIEAMNWDKKIQRGMKKT